MKKYFLLLVAFVFIFSSCLDDTATPDDNKIIHLDEKSAQLIEADNAFGLELFQKVREGSDEENIMISPLSVSLALAMTYNGADGTTKTAMEETLKLAGLTTDEINASYQYLVDALLEVDDDVLLDIANAIFYRQGFTVEEDFVSVNNTYYDAEVSALDFTNPDAKDIMNNWVAEKTNDKIKEIIDHISGDHVMFLLNAVYFKGTWKYEFDEDGTHELPFTKNDGSVIQAPMMNQEGTHLYQSNELFEAVKLPYGNGHYNMVVLVPKGENTLGGLVAEISATNWGYWMGNFSEVNKVNVTMPRFKFEFEEKLNDALIDMGMGVAFTPGVANFTKINKAGHLNIDEVKHKTFIDVNETGTEAAAVTSVSIVFSTAMPADEKIYFRADKPFLFAITEEDIGAILFIGEVTNPVYED